jgi:hypothetical protein
MVCLAPPPGLSGQQELSHHDVQANHGRQLVRTDNAEDSVEWEFTNILDYSQIDNSRWYYLVGWKEPHAPT